MGVLEGWSEEHEEVIDEIKSSISRLKYNPLSILGLSIFIGFIVIAVIAPHISPYSPLEMHYKDRLNPPCGKYWLGTDEHGRDVFSRILHGTKISLYIGIMVIAIAVSIGSIIGVIAGYFGGKLDNLFMRITDIFLAFPSLILAMAISASLGRNLTNMMLAIAITRWPTYARLMRGQALIVKEELFVEAARSIGSSRTRIIFHHILPNCLAPIIIQSTLGLGRVIITAASLSFIGFGAQPPIPEWGVMVSDGRWFIMKEWWLSTFPGLAIFIVVLGLNLFGDSLRDIWDPRLRRG